MPGKFPFRSSSPANPEIHPQSIGSTEVPTPDKWLPRQGGYDVALRKTPATEYETLLSEDEQTRLDQFREDAKRSPTMARFFEDVARWRNDAAVLRPLWSWPGVIAIAGVLEAAGVNAMFGKQYAIAIGLVLIACTALAVRGITGTKNWRQSLLIFTLCLLAFVLHVLWIMYSASQQ